jgi:hypothetical protein
VSSDWPRPQSNDQPPPDEALTIWRLRHASRHLRCFVAQWPTGFWIGVERDGGELVISETLPDIAAAVARTDAIKAPLVADGWWEE